MRKRTFIAIAVSFLIGTLLIVYTKMYRSPWGSLYCAIMLGLLFASKLKVKANAHYIGITVLANIVGIVYCMTILHLPAYYSIGWIVLCGLEVMVVLQGDRQLV